MKRFLILLSVVTIFGFLLVGCYNESESTEREIKTSLLFEGESLNWKGKHNQESTETWKKNEIGVFKYDSFGTREFVLEYKGDNPDDVDIFKYKFESSSYAESGDAWLNDEGFYTSGPKMTGGALLRDFNVIQVTVEWNDEEEFFEMVVKE